MLRRRNRASALTAALSALAFAAVPFAAGAGGGPGDPDSAQEHGTHFFGEVKDVAGLAPVEGARVKVAIAGTAQFLVVLTDAAGLFRLEGFGKDVPADKVNVTCDKEGYRQIEALRRQMGANAGAPIEVECLLARDKPRERS
jgi:hypothetical protein